MTVPVYVLVPLVVLALVGVWGLWGAWRAQRIARRRRGRVLHGAFVAGFAPARGQVIEGNGLVGVVVESHARGDGRYDVTVAPPPVHVGDR